MDYVLSHVIRQGIISWKDYVKSNHLAVIYGEKEQTSMYQAVES